MQYIFVIFFMVLTLDAQIEPKEMYAQVISKSADLYKNPYECSKKKKAYFEHGDMVEIEYCNKYRWCKAVDGFVKKDFLRLPEPLRSQDKPLPNARMVPREVKKVAAPQKIETVEKVELIAEPVITQESNSAAVVTLGTSKEDVKLDAYEEYFKDESAKVIFVEQ